MNLNKNTPDDDIRTRIYFLKDDVDGKMKEVEELDVEEILEFIKNEKAN